jgi:hypothetical protein
MTGWRGVLVAGVLAGIGALTVIVLLQHLSISKLTDEIATYLRRRDEFNRYLQERDEGEGGGP